MTTTINKIHRHTPHTDMLSTKDPHRPHKVILFYLNVSDGDTYFYDKEHKIIDSVTPKGNRAVLFDGSLLHSSSKPIEFARRIVLNINLIDEEKLNNLLHLEDPRNKRDDFDNSAIQYHGKTKNYKQ